MAAGTTVVNASYMDQTLPSTSHNGIDPPSLKLTSKNEMEEYNHVSAQVPLVGTGIGVFGYDGGTAGGESMTGGSCPVDPKVCHNYCYYNYT